MHGGNQSVRPTIDRPNQSQSPDPRVGVSDEELATRFTYHRPESESQVRRYETLRAEALAFAVLIADFTPTSREQSLALTALEEAVFWANAAIARRS